MIPIPVNNNTIEDYKENLLKYIKKKDGKNQINTLDSILAQIEHGLTLEKLITLDCNEMSNLKHNFNIYYGSLDNKKRADPLISLSIFKTYYKDFISKYGTILMENLGVEVCPYCNRNYIFNANERRTSEFDHFFPKDKYWIFAISFYNLIPVCHTCNHIKSNKTTNLISPYDKSLKNDTFKFKPIIEEIDNFDIKLEETNIVNKDAAEALNNDLRLKELYTHHSYLVKELYEKSQLYTSKYIQALKSDFFDNTSILPTQADFNRIILGAYGEDKDFLLHPLSKATKDIAEEIGLFKNLTNSNIK